MDKHSSETIKIKINGKGRPMSQAEETTEEIPYSNFKEKNEAKNEIASAKQPVEKEDDFPWLLPDKDELTFEDDPKVVTPLKKKKMFSNQSVTPFHYSNKRNYSRNFVSFPIKRILTILLLAIGLGVMFGYIALNFLSNEDMPAMGLPNETINEKPVGETSGQSTEENNSGASSSATSSASLQLYAVQGGKFSAKSGAEMVAADIKEKGLASVIFEVDGFYTVFAGLGKEKTETNQLNELYKQNDFKDFWGGKQLSVTIATGSAADQWASSIKELSSLASAVLNGKNISQENVSEIESMVKDLKANNDTEKTLKDKLLEAASNIKKNSGWEAQQNLLEVVSKFSTT